MKHLSYGIVLVLLIFSCDRNQIKVKGKISDCTSKGVSFDEVDIYQIRPLDSVRVRRSGKFSFRDKIKYPKFYQLRFDNDKTIQLLIEPGEKVNVTADFANMQNTLQISGSEGSVLMNEIVDTLTIAIGRLDSVSNLYENTTDPEMQKNLILEYERIMNDHRRFTINFILNNTRSLASFRALYQQYHDNLFVLNKLKDLQFYKIVTDSLVKKYPRVKQVILLKKNTQKMLSEFYTQRLLSMAQKGDYGVPDISLPDAKGDTVNLKSFKGKYILLNFWATWNNASADYNPKLKDIYNKYHKKGFEIYQVSLDKSYNDWMRLIRFDELNWINVIDTTGQYSRAAAIYNIQTLPANYLIDKDFTTIISKNMLPAELDIKLSELLK